MALSVCTCGAACYDGTNANSNDLQNTIQQWWCQTLCNDRGGGNPRAPVGIPEAQSSRFESELLVVLRVDVSEGGPQSSNLSDHGASLRVTVPRAPVLCLHAAASRCKREPLGVVLKSRPARRPSARRPPAVRPRSTEHQVLNSIRLQHNAEYSAAAASRPAPSTQQHFAARENP